MEQPTVTATAPTAATIPTPATTPPILAPNPAPVTAPTLGATASRPVPEGMTLEQVGAERVEVMAQESLNHYCGSVSVGLEVGRCFGAGHGR